MLVVVWTNVITVSPVGRMINSLPARIISGEYMPASVRVSISIDYHRSTKASLRAVCTRCQMSKIIQEDPEKKTV